MGCDIHLCIEIKVEGTWMFFNQCEVDRCYALFGLMAGVRDETVIPIVNPLGLPSDVTEMTQILYDYMEENYHSASWLGVPGIRSVREWFEDNKLKWAFHRTFGWLFEAPFEELNNVEDVRFVFWFDN